MDNLKGELSRQLIAKKSELAATIMRLQSKSCQLPDNGDEEAARQKAIEETESHLVYLSEAVQVESHELFNHYLEWTFKMLEARDIPANHLVQKVKSIQQVIAAEFSAADAAIAISYLEQGAGHIEKLEPGLKSFLNKTNPLASEATLYLDHLLNGRRDDAARLIDELVNRNVAVPDIYEYIFQATQNEVGVLWQKNEITVAHEHYCTAATQLIMSQLYAVIFSGEKNGLKLIACSVASELHEIGIRMVSDFFEMDGWDTYYMGSNMPEKDLLQSLREHQANLLAISVTMPIHINRVESIIRHVRDLPEFNDLKIMVGGYPFGIIPGLAEKLGADATAVNARQAILTANEMIK